MNTPQKKPPQKRPLSSSQSRNYDEIMRNQYRQYRIAQARRRRVIRIAAILSVLAFLIIVIILVSFSCNKSSAPAKIEEISSQSEVSKAIEAITEISKQEESEPEQKRLLFEQKHTHTDNLSRFSRETIDILDDQLTSQFVALYDVTSDEIIYMKNGTEQCFPASTTKMMTAIVSSQIITDPSTVITVGDEITLINWDSSIAGLQQGMVLTYEMLLDALMLPSGNDAAYTIAVNCGRIYSEDPKLSNEEAVKVFMDLVNEAAQDIGASQTHYVTPDGWHDDNHFTSARDLAIIGEYAKSIPIVNNSCSKVSAEWELISGETMYWTNSNKLILPDSEVYSRYCDGIKTGFTDEAGTSVVASATIEGHTFVAAVMNGLTLYTKYYDCHLLFEKAFALYDLKYTSVLNQEESEDDSEESEGDTAGTHTDDSISDNSSDNSENSSTETSD